MTYATTFSGIGGWELGLNACGWDLKWQCECEPYARKVLAKRFGVPIYPDIRTLAGENPPRVDALVGSPPCQPFSVAGKRGGTSDERHLYPSFLSLVGQVKPRWVLMEQVPSILSMEEGRAFGAYVGGLAALGYDLVWHCIPACAVGAPHRRDRLWIVAHAQCDGRGQQVRIDAERESLSPTIGQEGAFGLGSSGEDVSHPVRERRQQESRAPHGDEGANEGRQEEHHHEPRGDGQGGIPHVPNPTSQRRGEAGPNSGRREERSSIGGEILANAARAQREGEQRAKREGSQYPDFVEPSWWTIEPSVGRVAPRIPDWAHQLKGLGNAVVPYIPFLIGQAINDFEASFAV